MASEIRANQIQSRTGLSTVTFSDTGVTVSNKISAGDTFIKDKFVGLGTITTADRNAGVSTALGTLIYNATSDEVQGYGPTGWSTIKKLTSDVGLTASGGTISDFTVGDITYRAHIFTSSGTFNVTEVGDLPAQVDYLVVAGGGGGGSHMGGGGGGGGLRSSHPDVPTGLKKDAITVSASPGVYTITVGAGGVGANATGNPGLQGGTSAFTSPNSPETVSCPGGGGGGSGFITGTTGGSGGGAAHGPDPGPGNTGGQASPNTDATRYGYPGGDTASPHTRGAGGGGSGGPGYSGGPTGPSLGGPGLQIGIIPSPPTVNSGDGYNWAGGGGGGVYTNQAGGVGGVGGGGGGSAQSSGPGGAAGAGGLNDGDAGTVGDGAAGGRGGFSTGGGGGGDAHPGPSPTANQGGSGIVILRYQIATPQTGTAKATGGSVSFYNGETIHVFNSTGTFTNTTGAPLTINTVVIAGGGGGGGRNTGGGGGAGGVKSNIPGFMPATQSYPVVGPGSPNALTITVGGGGAGGPSSPHAPGLNGGNSRVVGPGPIDIQCTGGGGGGKGVQSSTRASAGNPGGSGGGGGGDDTGGPFAGGSGGTGSQGNDGGAGASPGANAGGGGGALGTGTAGNPSGPNAGPGGAGVQLPAPLRSPVGVLGQPGVTGTHWFAGGGGGGGNSTAGGGGNGPVASPYAGAGAGGAGNPGAAGESAENGTGSGGGGCGGFETSNRGGNGGSGIVIITYPS